MPHKQKFAINFEATPFLEEFFFLMLYKQKFAIDFEATPILVVFVRNQVITVDDFKEVW